MSKSNYRKKLASSVGFEIPSGFDVHHIDHRRTNNSINNLVAIPKSLHREYHKYYQRRWCIECDYIETGNIQLLTSEDFQCLTIKVNDLLSQILDYYTNQQFFHNKN